MWAAECARIADAINAGGIVAATTDPRNLQPPMVLVGPESGEPRTGCSVSMRLALVAVAPGAGHGDALAWLDTAVDAVFAALGRRWPWELTTAETTAGSQLMACRITISGTVQVP